MQLKIVARGERSRVWSYGAPVLAVLATLVVTGVIFALLGRNPFVALFTFFVQPLLNQDGIPELLLKASPLITIAVGLVLCYRANVWNIGAEGQLTLGAIAGGGVGLAFPDAPAGLLFPAMMIAGVIGGALWAAIPAWLRTQFNANEILTSLMLTYVAQLLLLYLISGPWRDPEGLGFPQTAEFSDSATAPLLIAGTRLHIGVLFAPLVAIAVQWILTRTVLGFQLRVVGYAPRAARFAGFREKRLIWIAMLTSGGLAGLAGLFEAAGPVGQLTADISPGYGFTAIIVAFLGRLNPLGAILGGLLLALSFLGGDEAQIDLGLPNAVTGIFQGVLLFMLLGADLLVSYRVKLIRNAKPAPVAQLAEKHP